MSSCGILTNGIVAAQCGKEAKKGTRAKVVLVNFDDIDREASAVDAATLTGSIVLKSGKRGYLFESRDNATIATATFEKGTYVNAYAHSVQLRLFTKDLDSKKFVQDLMYARLVAIVQNKENGEGGNMKYEIYGYESGLTLSAAPVTTDFADGIAYDATISSEDGAKESTLPISYFDTDEETTDAALASLHAATTAE